jgi:hypothetical protein
MSLAPLPKVPWTTALSHVAEGLISARLSYIANVNKLHSDLGIDFHCEMLRDNTPSGLVFYVQAKGTQNFDETWSQSIPKSTVRYWLSQTHPVVLVVLDEPTETCYWLSIEAHRHDFLRQFNSASETIPVTVDRSQTLAKGVNGNAALVAQLKADQRSVMLWMGYPMSEGEGYIRNLPAPPRSRYELAKAEENLIETLRALVRYYMNYPDWSRAHDLAESLTKIDKSHYNQFVWLAQIQEMQGDKSAALLNWKEALSICERDKASPREWIEELKRAIRTEIERLEASI